MVAAIEKDSDMELTDKLLHFDSLSEAEKITGKSYKEDSDTTWMGMALLQQNNKIKHEILESQDDVCWGCKIDNYIRILTDLGFVKISEESFNGTGWDDKDIVEEKCYVYWQPSKSILSWFESFNKTDLNTSHWYFAYKPNSVQLFYDVGIHCSGGWYTGLENPTEKPSLPESEWIYMGNWDALLGHLLWKCARKQKKGEDSGKHPGLPPYPLKAF